MLKRTVLGALVVSGFACTLPLRAQVERSGGNSAALAALAQQYQQASAERAQLQADNAKLKKDQDALKSQLDAVKHQLDAVRAAGGRSEVALAAARAQNDSGAKNLADTRAKMQELIDRFRMTIATLQQVEADGAKLQQQLTQSQTAYDQCAVTNSKLAQVTNEVLNRYEHQGAISYLARAEPFTRLKRTQVANLAYEYQQRAEALRIPANAPGAAGANGGAGASTAASPTRSR